MVWIKTACVLGACFILFACVGEAAPLFPENEREPSQAQDAVYVDIKGEVRNPGVYKVHSGSRLFHLVELSGGFTKNAAVEGLGLSELLVDGAVYHIPTVNRTSPSDETAAEGSENEKPPAEKDQLVSINSASMERLTTLPAIGPATAEAIIEHRELNGHFESPEDLMDVQGIGEKTFEGLESLITLQP